MRWFRALEVRERGEDAGVHAGFLVERSDDFVQHRLVHADEGAPARDRIGHYALARVVEHELEFAGDPSLQRRGDRFPEIVRRQDAIGARDVVEHEAQMHARGLRVRVAQQEIGAVGAQEAGELVHGCGNDFLIDRHPTLNTGLLCIVLSPKLGSPIAWRLPSPPHTIGTI